MTWSYDDSLDTTKDKARFRIGDTDEDGQLLSDQEIVHTLAAHGDDVDKALPDLLRACATKLARHPEAKKVGRTSYTYGELAERYRKEAAEAAAANLSPSFGVTGQSVAGKEGAEEDTDRVAPKLGKRFENA